jgi:transcriptional regulator GlxA family with amidase domain
MPRRASYIPLSHDDYMPRLFRKAVRPYPDKKPGAVDQAKEHLLHSSVNVNNIARKVGYCDAQALRRAFKRETGLTISQWLALQVSTGSVSDPP